MKGIQLKMKGFWFKTWFRIKKDTGRVGFFKEILKQFGWKHVKKLDKKSKGKEWFLLVFLFVFLAIIFQKKIGISKVGLQKPSNFPIFWNFWNLHVSSKDLLCYSNCELSVHVTFKGLDRRSGRADFHSAE